MEERTAILEALIFASETPLTPERAAEILADTGKKEIVGLLEELTRQYEERGGGIRLVPVAGGFQFRTRQDLAPWIRKLKASRPSMLSPAALETLAVIAYRQPLVKGEIDRIRGVDASGSLKGLLDKKLVRILGRKDVPGKPIIYGTTKKFLEVFNLTDLAELPTLRELKDLQDEGEPEQLTLLELDDLQNEGNKVAPPPLSELKDQPDVGGAQLPALHEAKDPENGAVAEQPPVPEAKDPQNGEETAPVMTPSAEPTMPENTGEK